MEIYKSSYELFYLTKYIKSIIVNNRSFDMDNILYYGLFFFFVVLVIYCFVKMFLVVFTKTTVIKKEIINDKTSINKLLDEYVNFMNLGLNEFSADFDNNDKLDYLCSLINEEKIMDIDKLAKMSGCTMSECIVKIRFLKSQKRIPYYVVDHVSNKLFECSFEDRKLIEKYKPYVYYNHLSIREIACRLPGSTVEFMDKIIENVYNELLYLDKNDLLPGIRVDEVDKEIYYFDENAEKKTRDLITVNCPSCGAPNDVHKGAKVRCDYCNFIIDSKKEKNQK